MLLISSMLSSSTLSSSGISSGESQAIRNESLPFTIRVVNNSDDLRKAVRIRHAAYMRHVPDFAQTLAGPESADMEEGVSVLLAESKLDGTPIGTMRIQTNLLQPLKLEQTLTLPERFAGQRLAEATRLGVAQERVGRIVTTALFKAYFLYCQQHSIDHMVITARAPVDRQYDRLLFKDVYPDVGYMPCEHVGNIPHRIMSLKVQDVHPLWKQAQHPLFNFFFNTYHQDINVAEVSVYQAKRAPRTEIENVMVASA